MFTIDGRAIAKKIREDLKQKIAAAGIKPGLAAILIGDDPASKLYVSLKEKACAEVGIHFEKHLFPATVSEQTIIKTIEQLNNKMSIHGILVQLPLPEGFETDKIIAAIEPKKDVDGFGPHSKAEPVLGQAVWRLITEALEHLNTEALKHLNALVIGKSDVFLQTVSNYLHAKHLDTQTLDVKNLHNSKSLIHNSDIIVVATGHPNTLTGNDFKDGAIVIDIGTNRLPDGHVVGDVDFESTKNKKGWITPVPGGVGPVTVATLLENTFELATKSK